MTAKVKDTPRRTRKVNMALVEKVLDGFDVTAGDIVLPVLRRTQEVYGYIPEDAVFALARRLKLPSAQLYGVATFYDQFFLEPKGRNVIRLCTNVACSVLGADGLMDHIGARLGVEKGGTTADGRFTLLEVECIGSCGKGPAMMVNDDFHYDLTPEGIDKILKRYR